jgi:exonuclease III
LTSYVSLKYTQKTRYNPGKAELQIDGYDLFIVESGGTAIRGVAIFVRKELLAEEVKVITTFQESIWISIKLNAKDKVIVGCAYKSPSSKQENLDELKSLMRNVSYMDKEYSHILIMGDFNYPKINWKQWTSSGVKDAEAFLETVTYINM